MIYFRFFVCIRNQIIAIELSQFSINFDFEFLFLLLFSFYYKNKHRVTLKMSIMFLNMEGLKMNF